MGFVVATVVVLFFLVLLFLVCLFVCFRGSLVGWFFCLFLFVFCLFCFLLLLLCVCVGGGDFLMIFLCGLFASFLLVFVVVVVVCFCFLSGWRDFNRLAD